MDTTRHQNTVGFIGVTYRTRNNSETAASPKLTPTWVAANESWKPRPVTCRPFNSLEGESSRQLSRSLLPLQGSWFGPLLGSSICLRVSLSSLCHYSLLLWGKEGSNEFGQFQGLLEANGLVIPKVLRSFPAG